MSNISVSMEWVFEEERKKKFVKLHKKININTASKLKENINLLIEDSETSSRINTEQILALHNQYPENKYRLKPLNTTTEI